MKKLLTTALLISAFFVSNTTAAQDKVRCAGITQTGKQCSRQVDAAKQYCYQHMNAHNNASSEATHTQCQAKTKKGTQCSRMSKTNSTYCFQHQYN